jgi:hypothetical protein
MLVHVLLQQQAQLQLDRHGCDEISAAIAAVLRVNDVGHCGNQESDAHPFGRHGGSDVELLTEEVEINSGDTFRRKVACARP